MPSGPIATYEKESSPEASELDKYNAVGPGWHPILRALDPLLQSLIDQAIQHATVVQEEYRDKECQPDASIKVVQIKEKFGGLRIYIEQKGLGRRIKDMVEGALMLAESLSLRTCEKCGLPGSQHGGMHRPQEGYVVGRVMTLCPAHQAEREALQNFPISGSVGDKI